jgi:hypothetical protein
MSYHELIQLYFERSNALQNYWTLYVVIIGGLLAFSSIRKQRDFVTTALVTVLFAFFAYKNIGAIHDVTIQRHATLAAIKAAPETPDVRTARGTLEPTLLPPEYEGVRNFHVLTDVLTVLALWAMERRRWIVARDAALTGGFRVA